MRLLVLAIGLISLGCMNHLGVQEWPSTVTTTTTAADGAVSVVEESAGGACKGWIWTFGVQDTSCTSGDAVSEPGAGLLQGLFQGLASVASGLFGSTTNEINVLPAQPVTN